MFNFLYFDKNKNSSQSKNTDVFVFLMDKFTYLNCYFTKRNYRIKFNAFFLQNDRIDLKSIILKFDYLFHIFFKRTLNVPMSHPHKLMCV